MEFMVYPLVIFYILLLKVSAIDSWDFAINMVDLSIDFCMFKSLYNNIEGKHNYIYYD